MKRLLLYIISAILLLVISPNLVSAAPPYCSAGAPTSGCGSYQTSPPSSCGTGQCVEVSDAGSGGLNYRCCNQTTGGATGGTTGGGTVPAPVVPACGGSGQPACSTTGGSSSGCNSGEVSTAFGCVPTAPDRLIAAILRFAISAGGGIALILMIIGSFRMIFSGGDPNKVSEGRQQFLSAALGLLFVLLSITILQIIGVDILKIPGWYR